MSKIVYFIQGSVPRLTCGVENLKASKTNLNNVHFILSGSSLMNPKPEITEAKNLERELLTYACGKKIHEFGQVHLNEMGVERLGCFYEGFQTINNILQNHEISEIIMPIEHIYLNSYFDCFSNILGEELSKKLLTKITKYEPTKFDWIKEFIIKTTIEKDSKSFENSKDWQDYISKLKYYNGTNKHKVSGMYPLLWKTYEKFFQKK